MINHGSMLIWMLIALCISLAVILSSRLKRVHARVRFIRKWLKEMFVWGFTLTFFIA